MNSHSSSIRVLLVDDFSLFREGVKVALERHGGIKIVGEAGEVDDAVTRAEQLQPDVVLLDMRLPGGGGLVALERITGVAPRAKVLVLTANDRPEGVVDAVRGGAAGYLTKRSGAKDLSDAVVAVAAGHSVVEPALTGHLMRELAGGSGTATPMTLSAREREAVQLVCEGLTDQEIAARLFVSTRTIQNDLRSVRERAGLKRRSELVHWAARRSLA
jgi:two-component system, NarL family, response regulator DevR